MRITIHRGLEQIGGCITEISTATSRVFIDLGQNLPGCGEPTTDEEDARMVHTLFTNNKCVHEAVIYTHCHGDHIDLFHHVPAEVPQYLGEGAKTIFQIKYEQLLFGESLNAIPSAERVAALERKIAIIRRMRTWARPPLHRTIQPIVVGDIRITPFFSSHSVYDSYMLLIEAEGKRIWHTGDFREHGYMGKGLMPVITNFATDIDLLITEGTMLGRASEDVVHESVVSKRMAEQMRQYKYVFVLASATDLERFVAIKNATKQSRRKLFVSGSFFRKSMGYIIKRERPIWKNLFHRAPDICNEDRIRQLKSAGFCVVCGVSHLKKVQQWKAMLDDEQTLLIYSSWDGYYKDEEQVRLNGAYKAFREAFAHCVDIHTSGHASCAVIEKVINAVRPKTGVLCIHRDKATSLAQLNIPDVTIINQKEITL